MGYLLRNIADLNRCATRGRSIAELPFPPSREFIFIYRAEQLWVGLSSDFL
jgi:hypothetical protein